MVPQEPSTGIRGFRVRFVLRLAILLITALLSFVVKIPARQSDPNHKTWSVGGGNIEITLPDEQMKLSSNDLMNWIKTAGNVVSRYYRRFPVPHLILDVEAGRGAGVRHGVTYPKYGGLINITVGRDSQISDLNEDWALTHEMIHLAFPDMDRDYHWIEEGIATYVEPVARARAGTLPVEQVWKEFIRDMPKGQPVEGDQGLDNTHTWGRTYWGGALFCLVADVRIHEQTKNRKGLEDALRGILNHAGNITQDMDIDKALQAGDKATGTHVLQDLHREMGKQSKTVDLDGLWKKLGVDVKDGTVVFNDKAPEADIRQAITRGVTTSNAKPTERSGR